MEIKESKVSQIELIGQLHRQCFAADEAQEVANLAMSLMKSSDEVLSLVALEEGELIGHVVFSPVKIKEHDQLPTYILAPLAVIGSQQNKGVGTALVEHGLNLLKVREVVAVFVLGDPNYYGRLGFYASQDIHPPYLISYPEAWQVKALSDGALSGLCGIAQCVDELMNPDYW
ncbi:N-acetyltransferase [Alginatibacterium sediminis]|uniref:N-acetyltransferase n=1 Tax=Alginatibacterium sediminis TaxID=2164068 RepID=A0A420E704_9ALTE|nr:N-acetyltransferase [Alginatibacterium sediminis]RKF14286.1 N-acetyltransferase [Alginatibacterium sediminis]